MDVTVYDFFSPTTRSHFKTAIQCINEVHTRFHNSNASNCFLDFNAETVLFSRTIGLGRLLEVACVPGVDNENSVS
jgi:hypothetical protein